MSGTRALPVAIAVMRSHRAMSTGDWRRARASVAHRVAREGYALLETFDVVGDAALDESVYDAVESMATRGEASALIVSGAVDRSRVDGIAAGFGMVMLRVPLSVEVSTQGGVPEAERQEVGHA